MICQTFLRQLAHAQQNESGVLTLDAKNGKFLNWSAKEQGRQEKSSSIIIKRHQLVFQMKRRSKPGEKTPKRMRRTNKSEDSRQLVT